MVDVDSWENNIRVLSSKVKLISRYFSYIINVALIALNVHGSFHFEMTSCYISLVLGFEKSWPFLRLKI